MLYWKLGTFLENLVFHSYTEAKHKGKVVVVVVVEKRAETGVLVTDWPLRIEAPSFHTLGSRLQGPPGL